VFHLAWKNLLQNRTQFILGVGGVSLALLLMIALNALLTGSEKDLVAYIEQSGADIFVAQQGVKNMHMAASAITYQDLDQASQVEGVADASPILYTTTVMKVNEVDFLSYIIGFDPTGKLGGPKGVVAGTKNLKRGEAIIDEAVARNQEIKLGDNIQIFGRDFTVVGLTRGLTNIVNSISFITLEDFQDIRGDDAISYILISIEPGADVIAVAGAITAQNNQVTALSQADFSREERQIIRDMSVEILSMMNFSGLLIGLAVTALTLYTNTLRKRQEYGVLKAVGAQNKHLYLIVIIQAFLSLGLGFIIAMSLVWIMGLLLPIVVPGMAMALTPSDLLRVGVSSTLIGVLAALIPAWQLSKLDPAEVFRG
jgi:putative ABC transport system permease protein